MNSVMAERIVTLANGGTGFVRLYQPEPADRCWGCKLHLSWDGHEETREIYGEDGYQALQLAMQIVPTFVGLTDAYKTGALKVFDCALRDRDARDPENRTYLEQFFDLKPLPRDAQ